MLKSQEIQNGPFSHVDSGHASHSKTLNLNLSVFFIITANNVVNIVAHTTLLVHGNTCRANFTEIFGQRGS